MPVLKTENFGQIVYEQDAVFEFPAGLPGFEERRRFLLLRFEEHAPLVWLQSLEDADLCFMTLPVLVVDPNYAFTVAAEERAMLGFPTVCRLCIGKNVACLAILSIRESGPTANLLAPLVINLQNRKGVQAIGAGAGYSHRHGLLPQGDPVCS